ncbi:hypothetical protein H2248_003233 [Termitomyces sp. 'cryptogamus']|nr:hypothetical protein H2248_003233 [Termitomyces sp. 'cryptogamus']
MEPNLRSDGRGASVADGTLPPVSSSKPVTPPPRPKDDVLKSGSTPIKNHRAVSNDLNAVPEDLPARLVGLHAEITGRVVGPVKVETFNRFFPDVPDRDARPNGKAASDLVSRLQEASREEDMYKHLVAYFKALCPSGLDFRDKHVKPIQVFEGQDITPDIIVYAKDEDEVIEAMFEVKYNDDDDPFDDVREGFVATTIRASQTLGQITGYATYHQAIEFRTHVFSALIFRTYMRLLRWDRSGVVVTEKIPFDNPLLFDFLSRFSTATAAVRGRDPTVTTARFDSPDLERKVRDCLECGQKSLLNIHVGNNNYIVLKDQIIGSRSPIGRSTRCLKAFWLKTNGLVLLKDTWRVLSPTLKPEHEIYEKLHKNQVPNIPQAHLGADIGKENDGLHTTQTKRCLKAVEKTLEITLRTFCHYRIVLEYLPYSLEDFENTREVIIVFRDASIGHGKAAQQAKVLHRDISNGNIMFKRRADGTVQGYLIDWDLSLDLTLASDQSTEAQPERTGTWQFLAVRLVQRNKTGKPLIQNRIDDVESFYHVILWLALRYTAHELDSGTLTHLLHENFDAMYKDPKTGETYIGTARRSNMKSGDLSAQAGFTNGGIKEVLRQMRHVLCQRYTNPKDTFGSSQKFEAERKVAEVKKAAGLKALEDSDWLPNLLDELLAHEKVDWVNNEARVDHVLQKSPNYTSRIPKRKTESSLHSPRSRKAARKSGNSTPQCNRSIAH